ncbi:MAG: hypothetical protein BroJett038_20570 [Chloroflexota bacterium]|nr:MAG: hypothetical protein BroJett038_20570 [Chloroflexota bacterium]
MNLRKLYQWVKKTSKRWDGVTRHFRENVQVFSRGVVRAESSQIRKIAGASGGRADSQRRRLQRFVAQQQPMGAFFQGWTRSVVKQMKQRTVVLVVDETKLKAVLGVMVVGVVYEGRCIPLAWRVYRANRHADYPREGQARMIIRLLKQVKAGMPTGTKVRVLADRGIGTSPLLMRGIMAMGWTFLFRVTKQSKIVLPNGDAVCFYDQVTAPGQTYTAGGVVFKKRGRIPGHVRVLWGERAQDRWALVTNDPTLTGWEYAQRMWIEEAFRDLKSHGWQVEQALCDCPERMARLWIFLVVAYAWMLFVGAALVAAFGGAALKRRADGSYVRRWSVFREGRQAFLAASPPS